MLGVKDALDEPDVEQQMVLVKYPRTGKQDFVVAWLERLPLSELV